MSFEQEFLQTCMQNMQDGLPAEQALKACSWVHFHANRMEELLAPLKGDLDGFLAFLSREWGWVITQCGKKSSWTRTRIIACVRCVKRRKCRRSSATARKGLRRECFRIS